MVLRKNEKLVNEYKYLHENVILFHFIKKRLSITVTTERIILLTERKTLFSNKTNQQETEINNINSIETSNTKLKTYVISIILFIISLIGSIIFYLNGIEIIYFAPFLVLLIIGLLLLKPIYTFSLAFSSKCLNSSPFKMNTSRFRKRGIGRGYKPDSDYTEFNEQIGSLIASNQEQIKAIEKK